MALFGRTGRWAFMRPEAVDRIPCPPETKAAIRASRKAFLLRDAFIDFFRQETEPPDDQDHDVRLSQPARS